MSELVPDGWRFSEEEQKCCHQQRRSHRRGPVTDILLWVECYSSLVAVLSLKFPEKTPQLMSYQQTIVKAHRTFVGEGWATYDACYRRKAAMTKSLEWGQVDFTLYNETFTGRAKSITRCHYCLSEYHSSGSCAYAPDRPGPSHSDDRLALGRQQRPSTQLCQLYNTRYSNKCRFNPCKFAHLCSECRGQHPVSNCNRGRQPPTKMPRAASPSYKRK